MWDSRHVVFVDESGVTTKMIRLYGRSPRGVRAHDRAPHGHWGIRTIIGALFGNGQTVCMTIDEATDEEIFFQYVKCVLVPALRPGDIVVFDNLSAHKQQRVSDQIEAAGCKVKRLPPYSPDLNPIEKMWSKFKAILRSLAACTSEELDMAIAFALDCVSSRDAVGWLASCGYII